MNNFIIIIYFIYLFLYFYFIRYRSSPKDADMVKGLACKTLLGLAKNPTIKQILTKKLSRSLSEMSKEPSDKSNIQAFDFFRSCVLELFAVL